MAASVKPHARIRLHFENHQIENSWFLVDYSEYSHVSDIVHVIKNRYPLPTCSEVDVILRIKECVLPSWESSLLLKDEDKVHVSVERKDESATSMLSIESDSSLVNQSRKKSKHSRKRKHEEEEALPIDKIIHKKKKKKKEKTETECLSKRKKDYSNVNSKDKNMNSTMEETGRHLTNHLIESETDKQLKEKGKQSSKKIKFDQLAECMKSVETHHDNKGNAREVSINACFDQNINSDGVETAINENEGKKKRKRVRKHRKRKSTYDTNISDSTADLSLNGLANLDNSNERNKNKNAYKGHEINKDDLFFGSIPDKLVAPKFYRHGYRNLNVYHPQPNKCKKFESDSEGETEVKENTEQYNFLSSTKVLEERDKYIEESKPANSAQGHNGLGNGSSELASSKHKKTSSPVVHSSASIPYKKEELNIDNGLQGKMPAQQNSDCLQNGTLSEGKTENDSATYTAQSYQYPDSLNRSRGSSNTSLVSVSPHVASPTVLERKQLANGVSVFTRTRSPRHNQGPFKGFTKEDQLNTQATNISTIFVNPVQVFKIPEVPEKKLEMFTPQESETSDEALITPDMVTSPETSSVTKEYVPSPTVSMLTKNYQQFPPLVSSPRPGDRIAYKVLEISSDYTPEVSAYREADVVSVDSDQMIQLNNIVQPNSDNQINKFLVEVEEDGEVLTNRTQEEEELTLHVSSLLEPRILN